MSLIIDSALLRWGVQGVGFVLSEPNVLQDRVSSSVGSDRLSGVTHLESSVLH